MDRRQVEDRTILLTIAGSHGYRLNTPESDIDYRGIFIADKPYYLGTRVVEQKDSGWDGEGRFPLTKDTTIYELKKVLRLMGDNNPNILELLWMSDYLYLNDIGKRLVDSRDIFLSKKVAYTFSGYANSQLKKIETHRKWLLDPPTRKPKPSDYGIVEPVMRREEINAFLEYLYHLIRGKIEYLEQAEELYKLITAEVDYKGVLKQYPLEEIRIEEGLATEDYTQKLVNTTSEFMTLLRKNQEYDRDLRHWHNYQQWQQTRNPARKGMEAKIGYDCKHGMHLIRLLKMGEEILRLGTLLVNREEAGDKDELMSIRSGEWTYEQVMDLADRLKGKMEVAMKQSSLPTRPNIAKIEELCIELVERMGWIR